MSTYITALYPDMDTARRLLDALENTGYERDSLLLITSGGVRDAWLEEPDTGIVTTGAGLVGAMLGGAVGLTAGAVPGGLVLAGPIAGFFAGVGAGGLSGTLVGALAEIGIPRREARTYATHLGRGRVLVGVDIPEDGDVHKARKILREYRPSTAPVAYEPALQAA